MKSLLNKLGPGLLFAGAAIGVSHLVQSTKAGATFGTGLIWAMIIVHLFKYPAFEFGARFTSSTNKTILDGYQTIGKWALPTYISLTFATMFTIQTAVTIVTAGIAESIFNLQIDIKIWSLGLLFLSALILLLSNYSFFDNLIKIVVSCLSISTIVALVIALYKSNSGLELTNYFPKNTVEISFLIAFMGWMPAPLDVSIWQSLWTQEKRKFQSNFSLKSSLFDFRVGYIGTLIIGICFLLIGALVVFNSGETFSKGGVGFANQFLQMYTSTLGNYSYLIIGIAAFTCMFSTTITALDASPRALNKAFELQGFKFKKGYQFWVLFLFSGTVAILFLLLSEMALLIKIATIVSFLTAPFYAILNHLLIFGKQSTASKPPVFMKYLSFTGILFLIGFGAWYLSTLI